VYFIKVLRGSNFAEMSSLMTLLYCLLTWALGRSSGFFVGVGAWGVKKYVSGGDLFPRGPTPPQGHGSVHFS
jgi:hypothetical protein